jgi:hypothetical protein
MKRASLFLTGMLMMWVTFTLNAQDQPEDFFAGKWECLVEGAPQGDMKMEVTLQRVDGKLTGELIYGTDSPASKFTRVDEKKDKSVTLYFASSGYDVYLYLEKKDNDAVEGSMMDMFDVTGKRVVEEK